MAKGKNKPRKPTSKRSQLVDALRNNGLSKKAAAAMARVLPGRGKLVFHVSGALAEFERDLIRERIHAAEVRRLAWPLHLDRVAARWGNVAMRRQRGTAAAGGVVCTP